MGERIEEFVVEFVDQMPDVIHEGILYISIPCRVGIHLCACGCGERTITPFDDEFGWKISEIGVNDSNKRTVTLRPSIGNYHMSCKSHYYITKSKVEWL